MIVTIGGTKGGSGKTTTATNLAVCAALDNKKVLLVDADPQGSAMAWRQIRDDSGIQNLVEITCISMPSQTIQADLKTLSANYDLTIVDVGGRDSKVLRASMIVSDIFVTPATPAVYDLWAVEDTIEIIKEARSFGVQVEAYLLFNQVLPQRTILERESKEVVGELEEHIVPLKSVLHARQDFKNSAAEGLGAAEFKTGCAAAEECNVLYSEIDLLLKNLDK